MYGRRPHLLGSLAKRKGPAANRRPLLSRMLLEFAATYRALPTPKKMLKIMAAMIIRTIHAAMAASVTVLET